MDGCPNIDYSDDDVHSDAAWSNVDWIAVVPRKHRNELTGSVESRTCIAMASDNEMLNVCTHYTLS